MADDETSDDGCTLRNKSYGFNRHPGKGVRGVYGKWDEGVWQRFHGKVQSGHKRGVKRRSLEGTQGGEWRGSRILRSPLQVLRVEKPPLRPVQAPRQNLQHLRQGGAFGCGVPQSRDGGQGESGGESAATSTYQGRMVLRRVRAHERGRQTPKVHKQVVWYAKQKCEQNKEWRKTSRRNPHWHRRPSKV